MTKRKTAITVDPAKADLANRLLGTTNFSQTVDRALDALIRQERTESELRAYEAQPLTTDEGGAAQSQLVGDPTDDTDWAELYREMA